MMERMPSAPVMTMAAAVVAIACATVSCDQPSRVTPERQAMAGASTPVSGTLRSSGAWALAPALRVWGEAYRDRHPAFSLDAESVVSRDGLLALATRRADLTPIARLPAPEDLDEFVRITGHEPAFIHVGYEAIAIAVRFDNPIQSITLTQLDAAFSTTRRRGGEPISHWRDLGVFETGGALQDRAFGDRRIRLVGPHLNAAGHRYFRQLVLRDGDFSPDMLEQPGPSAVMNAASAYPDALTFSSRALPTQRARLVPVAVSGSDRAIPLNSATVSNGSYPLARMIYVAIRRPPGAPVEPLLDGFLRFVLSERGQQLAAERGMYPLSPAQGRAQLSRLD